MRLACRSRRCPEGRQRQSRRPSLRASGWRPFSIDVPTELVVPLHLADGDGGNGGKPRLVYVLVEAVGPSLLVCCDLTDAPPYRLVNDFARGSLRVRQKGGECSHLVPPRGSLGRHTFSRPMLPFLPREELTVSVVQADWVGVTFGDSPGRADAFCSVDAAQVARALYSSRHALLAARATCYVPRAAHWLRPTTCCRRLAGRSRTPHRRRLGRLPSGAGRWTHS